MLDNHESLNGVSTTAYVGRQRQAQDLEEAVREKARILTRTYQRDNRLLWAVAGAHHPVAHSGAGNLWQGRTGVQKEPYVVLVDHLGNHAPVLKLADLPVTPEQSIIVGTLMSWLEHVRTISSDRVVLGRNWERVEDFTSTGGPAPAGRLSAGAETAATARAAGRDHVPPGSCPFVNPARIPPNGKRKPTIRTDACSRTSRALDSDPHHCRFFVPGGPAGTRSPAQAAAVPQPAGDCRGRSELERASPPVPTSTAARRIVVWHRCHRSPTDYPIPPGHDRTSARSSCSGRSSCWQASG